LFVAGGGEPTITRLTFDTNNANRIVASRRLIDGVRGRITALALSSDGDIYFCLNGDLMRLVGAASR
jgi:hypothetical protein